ncbi:hypothetical protein J3458_001309 [Metarhizium acridum]|uniref:uncharacterized protein n=1 Tax=Metarhizium acridum TaxID=92637 RepID=UPI001C6ACA72|nr:hypothetical protein J3458_001309 [Metarhizium acridum]
MAARSISQTLASFDKQWSPRLVTWVNDQDIEIAKTAHSSFTPIPTGTSCSMFFQRNDGGGRRRGSIEMHVYFFPTPRDVRHRPVAQNAHITMVERAGRVNTGGQENSKRTNAVKDGRHAA